MFSHEAHTRVLFDTIDCMHTILATDYNDFQELNCQFGVSSLRPNRL